MFYPIFVYSLLDLIYLQKTTEFKEFFDESCSLIEDPSVQGRAAELDQLRRLRSEQDIDHNPIANKFWHSRASVEISEQSFDLLTRFLHEQRLYNILHILHDRLSFELYPGIPLREKMEPILLEDAIPVNIQKQATIANAESLQLGLLSDTLEDKVVLNEDKDKPKNARRTKMIYIDNENRIKSSFPMSAWSQDDNQEIRDKHVKDIENRERVSCDNLPSICCATFLNTHRMMTTCHMLSNEMDIAGGFGDSSIQLRSLKSSKEDVVASNAMIEDDHEIYQTTVPPGEIVELLGHSGPITGLTSTVDEKILLSSSGDSTVRLWSLALKRCLVVFKGHTGPVWDVAACPRRPYFATGGWDGTARIWSTEHVKPLRLLVGHMADVDCIAWHPNIQYLASGSSDCTVRLWDVASGKAVRVLTGGHKHKISSVAVSPNGKVVASGAIDGSITLWDLDTAKAMATFVGHERPIWSLDFDRYGKLLASGSGDATVSIWDATAAVQGAAVPPVRQYETKDTPIYDVHFTRTNLLFAMGEFSSNN